VKSERPLPIPITRPVPVPTLEFPHRYGQLRERRDLRRSPRVMRPRLPASLRGSEVLWGNFFDIIAIVLPRMSRREKRIFCASLYFYI
jgi:hypothetical protein